MGANEAKQREVIEVADRAGRRAVGVPQAAVEEAATKPHFAAVAVGALAVAHARTQSATSMSKPSAVRWSARKVRVASSSSIRRIVARSRLIMPPIGRERLTFPPVIRAGTDGNRRGT